MSKVNWYNFNEVGAPNLSNAENSLNDVLYACLVTGFNTKTVNSISVLGGLATVSCTGHGFSGIHGQLVEIEGTHVSGLDEQVNITVVNADTFTFSCPGVTDGVRTGTLTAKRPGLGWTREFAGTGKAIYKKGGPDANSPMLRVVDLASASTIWSRAQMIGTASGIDTFTDPSPTNAQLNGGVYWFKDGATDTNRIWYIYGDEKFFYIVSETQFNWKCVSYFGDPVPYKSPDPFFTIIGGGPSPYESHTHSLTPFGDAVGNGANIGYSVMAARNLASSTKSVAIGIWALGTSYIGNGGQTADSGGEIIFSQPAYIVEQGPGKAIRGHFPGLATRLNMTTTDPSPNEVVGPVLGSGRIYHHNYSSAYPGGGFGNLEFDVTDTWR